MKRKELMKRALSLALCAMMTVGNLPSVTYASDLSPTDTGVVSQAEEADGKQSAEEAAQAYLKENFINGAKKVITNGGNSVVKSTDSLTYNIGLKTPSGSVIDALRLLTVSSSSNYVGGWYIEENDYLSYPSGGTPASPGRLSITRPTVNTPIKITLKLFAKDTDTATINDGTATALATQDFTFILEAAEVEYKMQVAVQDKDKNPITDASITVEKDGWDKVTPYGGSGKNPADSLWQVSVLLPQFQIWVPHRKNPAKEGLFRLLHWQESSHDHFHPHLAQFPADPPDLTQHSDFRLYTPIRRKIHPELFHFGLSDPTGDKSCFFRQMYEMPDA